MQSVSEKGSAELIAQARVALAQAKEAADDLGKAREQLSQTVAYVKWWRFLGYDPHAAKFLEKLDMPTSES